MNSLKKIIKLLHKWKHIYLFSSILITLSTLIRLFEPKVLQVTIDGVLAYFVKKEGNPADGADAAASLIYQIIPDITTNSLSYLLLCLGGVYLVVSLLRALTRFWGGVLTVDATQSATKSLRDKLFRHIQLLPISYHDSNRSGELIQRATGDVDTIQGFLSGQLVEIVRMLAIFGLSFYFMAIVDLEYALITICLTPFIFITSLIFFKKERKVWEEHEEEADKLTSMVSENLSGIRVVQAFAQEKNEIDQFQKQNEAKRKMGFKHSRLHANFWPFSDLMVHAQITISMIFGGMLTLNGVITVGELISFYTYALMVTWPMQRMGRLVSQTGMAVVAMERIAEILDAQEEDYTGVISMDKSLEGRLAFEGVNFAYPNGEQILKNITFNLIPGEKLAVVGPAGSGKSTLIKLLCRFYEPDSGRIVLDGKPLDQYPKRDLRAKLGVVLQKAFLFSNSIEKNISYTQQHVREEEVEAAAQLAQIHNVLHIFPEGYQTLVGEKGVTLSGGQKQRVTIARTLLEQPDLYVFDDSTSALDTETEYGIQTGLKKELTGKTSIIIAHRVTSIQNADRIMVMNNGQIENIGTHEELLQDNDFYREMFALQINLEEEIGEA